MTVRIYLRRSKNDEGKQQFSLDVQRNGCLEFARRLELSDSRSLVEYIDDGKAGDDFHTRGGIRRLLGDARPGDIIICRDQSRLGRDALEVTLVVRDLVRDQGCRLFYYTTGQEVQFANAIDQVTTFIQGTGHQMELEAIRSRTREALRARVRAGRIAGGRCYGYRLERKHDGTGRPYTVAVVDEEHAAVVRRIYADYLIGQGLKRLTCRLNEEGIPSPTVGRRGSGSWSQSGVRAMLGNPRYRGLYIHGRTKKIRRAGRVRRVKADPADVITIEIPEWRIIDDETWFAVQDVLEQRGRSIGRRGRPAARFPLSGIGRCGHCGGSIGSAGTRMVHGRRLTTYACLRHHKRGSSVCPVSVYQVGHEVEAGLLGYLQEHVMTPHVVDTVLAEARAEIERELATPPADIAPLRRELHQMRAEQRRLARAIAMIEDAPELLSELTRRRSRIRRLETQLAEAKRTPTSKSKLVRDIEASVQDKLRHLDRVMLHDREGLRDVFLAAFPDGLLFTSGQKNDRRVWAISPTADPDELP